MLPASAHVKEVYTGADGILRYCWIVPYLRDLKFQSAVQKGTILMDSSTIDPETAKQVGALVSSKGAHMVIRLDALNLY